MTLRYLLTLVVIPLALVSLFTLPWTISLLLMAGSAAVFPLSALVLGVIADILYYPGVGSYVGVLWGTGVTIVAYGVRYVLRNCILER